MTFHQIALLCSGGKVGQKSFGKNTPKAIKFMARKVRLMNMVGLMLD